MVSLYQKYKKSFGIILYNDSMKPVTPKTSGFSPGRKIFIGEDVRVSLDSELPEGYDYGFEANEDIKYAVRLRDGAKLIKPGPFSQWRYLTGSSPYRRYYIDIDYTFNENNEFSTYSDYFVPGVFSNYFPVWANRGEYEYVFIYGTSSTPDKVSCFRNNEEVWSYFQAGARGASARMVLFMDNYIVLPTAVEPTPGQFYSGITILDYDGTVVYENAQYLGPYTNQNHPDADYLHHTGGDTFYYQNSSTGTGARRLLKVEDGTLIEVNLSVVEFHEWFGNNYFHTSPTGTYISSPFDNVVKVNNETGAVIWENNNIDGVGLIQLNPYTDNVLISTYFSTYDGGVTYDDFANPRLIELDGETGEILRNHVDEAADSENGFMQHGCFLSEKTFMYYDSIGENYDTLEITFFDLDTWSVRSKKLINGYVNNNIRGLPMHFRNGVACFPVLSAPGYSDNALVFVDEEENVNIVQGTPFDTYVAPPTCTFDGKILFSAGGSSGGSRLLSYGNPRIASLIVKSLSFSNGVSLLIADFGENILIEDSSLISLSGTVSGEITPLIINDVFGGAGSRVYIESLTPSSGETLTLTISPGSISGEYSDNQIFEELVLTIEVP